MSVSSPGTGEAGFDGFVQQMLYLEARPLRDLQARRSVFTDRLGILSDIRSKVATFKSLANTFGEMGPRSALRKYEATSSNEAVLTASADSGADIGSHVLTISQLAQAHTIASTAFGASATTTIAAQTHTFELNVAGTTTQVSVEVLATDTNDIVLTKVRDAIRSAVPGVTATVLTVDTTTNSKKLVLASAKTGGANLIQEVRDVTGNLATQLGLAGTSAAGAFSANTTIQGQDALLTLDAIAIASGTNEVAGVLPGVVLSLKGPTAAGTSVTLSVKNDREGIKTKMTELIGVFNDLMSTLNGHLASGDETGQGRGALAGDLSFTTFRNGLKDALVSRLDASFTIAGIDTLDDIGLSVARNGALSISDEEKFFNAIAAHPDAVESYFGSTDGVFARLADLATDMTGIKGGLDLARDQIESRREVLDLRIERQQAFLKVRERQLRDELGRLSQFAAQLGAQQSAFSTIGASVGAF